MDDELKKIIEDLKRQIESCWDFDMEEASWALETGVILTGNDAKKIVEALENIING